MPEAPINIVFNTGGVMPDPTVATVPPLPPVRPAAASRSHHRLQAMMRTDRQPLKAELPDVKGDAGTAVIRLYDPIDSWGEWWGVSAKEFAEVLDELPDTITTIELLINSPGGEVYEGIAILNQLRRHPARVVAVVEGLAASAASYVAAGADELIMAPNSELMIHDAWGLCVGNAEDMTRMAADLGRLCDNIASIYAAKAGGTVDDWRALMAVETWFSASEAVESGLADRVLETSGAEPTDPQPANRWDLSIFNFAGRDNAPGPQASATPPSPTARPGQEGASTTMDLSDIREALGLADDIGDEDVLSAVLDRLTAPDEPEPAPEASLPEGVVTIDAAQLDQLRADASAGREARDEQRLARREQLVAAAVADGRIPPARKQHWLNQLEADAGAEQVLAALEPGLVPVDQRGHGGNVDLDTDDAMYAELYGSDAEVKA